MNALILLALLGGTADDWQPGIAANLAPFVDIKDGTVTLRNRGLLLSTKTHDEVTVSFTWKWTKGDEAGKYQDHLCVVFGTDGRQRPWAHEIEQGTLVRFNPGSGSITVEKWQTEMQEAVRLASKDGFTFTRDMAYDVRLVLQNGKLTVHVDGKKAVSVDLPKNYHGGMIAIYDREPVAGIVKESQLTKLTIE